ncbi:MAG TPA: THUMP domain-containing protein [Anaeromyxobacteraceae bacterium]|jgi:putative N6-adenine-specific DNA methylase|nr:THUMP domain-containing protein [Anaeromyxobacteraceae bacterium]
MKFFATCAKGTEGPLRSELSRIGLKHLKGDRGGVRFEGKLEAGMRACLHSRVAMRVLLELATFPAPDADALYEGARAIAWEEWLTERTTLAVDATVKDSALTHSQFVALKVKDAVVDSLREKLGGRPDVDPKDPDVRIVLHLANDQATLSLDLAGHPLHRRGYRAAMTDAPLKETLAAAVLALGQVDPALPFVDPMCGSGTLAIEHALAARRIAPGLGRAFGFQRWPAYRGAPQSRWDLLKEEARAAVLPAAPAPIVARDFAAKPLEATRLCAAAAGVLADLRVERADVRDLAPEWPEGTLCVNPPYGERLTGTHAEREARRGRDEGRGPRGSRPAPHREAPPDPREEQINLKKLTGLYRQMGEVFLRHHRWSVVILSGSPLLEEAFPFKAEISHRLWNGPIEARMLRYRMP